MIIPNFYKTILTVDDTEVNLYNESSIDITCQLLDFNGNPVIGEEVDIKVDGTVIATKKTNTHGLITYTYDCSSLDEGYYTVSANESHVDFKVLFVSPWFELSLASGYKHYQSDQHLAYRRVGNIVEIRGVVAKSGAITPSGSWVNILSTNIPVGYRPYYSQERPQQGSGENRVLWQVSSDGSINWRYYGTTASNTQMPDNAWLNIYFQYSI